jgi:hypothetical protein
VCITPNWLWSQHLLNEHLKPFPFPPSLGMVRLRMSEALFTLHKKVFTAR